MAKYTTLYDLFTAIANALRGKTGSTGKIVADDFPSVIDSLSTGGITPTGTKSITTNGTHDVTSYASAQVNVPTGITPSGGVNITENGTYDVTQYASAQVNVPMPEENMVVLPITLSADLGAGTNKNQSIVTGNEFVKAHYADEGFVGIFVPVSGANISAVSNVVTAVFQGNRVLTKSNYSYYGLATRCTGASATLSSLNCNYPINGTGYNVSLRVNSSGNVNLYVGSTYTVKAGNYLLVLLVTD